MSLLSEWLCDSHQWQWDGGDTKWRSRKLIPTPKPHLAHISPCKTAFELEVNKKPSVGGKIFFFSISQEICSERKKLHDSAFSYVSARVNNSEPRSKFVGCGQLFSWNKKFKCLHSLHVLVNWLRRRNDESFWSWRAYQCSQDICLVLPWERTCHFSWRCKIKWIHELDKNQKKGVTGLRGMELFSSTSLSTVLMDVEANNGENMHSSRVKRHMVWVSRDKNIFTIPVL